jgi:hypothetical protein
MRGFDPPSTWRDFTATKTSRCRLSRRCASVGTMHSKTEPLTEEALEEYEADRDLAADVLQAIRQMKAGEDRVIWPPPWPLASKPGCPRRSLRTCWACLSTPSMKMGAWTPAADWSRAYPAGSRAQSSEGNPGGRSGDGRAALSMSTPPTSSARATDWRGPERRRRYGFEFL